MRKGLFVMALVMSYILASCGEDKKNEEPINFEQELIGRWERFEQNYTYSYSFYSDHKGRYIKAENVNGEITSSRHFTWSLNGNIVTAVSVVNENMGPLVLSHENGILYLIDSYGILYAKK